MAALSTISDPSLRDWVSDEVMTEGRLEADPAAINTAVTSVLDYLVENERHFASAAQPTDTADGMIWYDSGNTVFKGRISSAWSELCGLTLTQTLTNKTFTSPTINTPTFNTGGSETHAGSGAINSDMTAVAQAGSTGVLITYTVPADTLDGNGKTLRVTCWGTKTNANAALSLQPRWGATALTTHTFSAACTDWFIQFHITRTGASAQDANSYCIVNRDDTASTTLVDSISPTKDETGALAVDINVSSIHGSDTATQEGQIVELLS